MLLSSQGWNNFSFVTPRIFCVYSVYVVTDDEFSYDWYWKTIRSLNGTLRTSRLTALSGCDGWSWPAAPGWLQSSPSSVFKCLMSRLWLLHGPLQHPGPEESDFGPVPGRLLQGSNTTCDTSFVKKSNSPTSSLRVLDLSLFLWSRVLFLRPVVSPKTLFYET